MRLYLTAETSIPDLYIDYIEVLLKSGEEVSRRTSGTRTTPDRRIPPPRV